MENPEAGGFESGWVGGRQLKANCTCGRSPLRMLTDLGFWVGGGWVKRPNNLVKTDTKLTGKRGWDLLEFGIRR